MQPMPQTSMISYIHPCVRASVNEHSKDHSLIRCFVAHAIHLGTNSRKIHTEHIDAYFALEIFIVV